MDQAPGFRLARNSVLTNKNFEPKWKQMLISAAKEIVRVWKQLAKQKFYISDEDKLISNMIMPSTNRSYSVTLYRHAKNFSIAVQGMSRGCVQASKFFSESLFTIADYVGSWNQKRDTLSWQFYFSCWIPVDSTSATFTVELKWR